MAADHPPLQVRAYGDAGPTVWLLHGGPGVAGYLAPVARGLADSFRVLEPLQRGSGGEPLTVARHVADLHELVNGCCEGTAPAIVGHSWGAMLALAYGAAHPDETGPLVLVGCGTFDPAARRHMEQVLAARTSPDLEQRLQRLVGEEPDPDRRLRAVGELTLPLYTHDPVSTALPLVSCDDRAHRESWEDMLRCQAAGRYPAAFAAIRAPVLMLHGAGDPHPGGMIRDSLAPFLGRLEYHEWARCGHYPWLERGIKEDFFAVLRRWLGRRLGTGRRPA